MYFVTTKRPGYALFCLTPSERLAIGVTEDQQRVHLLERSTSGEWQVGRDLAVTETSHTDMMVRLGKVVEPGSFDEFARSALRS